MTCINAAIDARTTIQITGGACSDGSIYTGGTVTLSHATIRGNVNVWTGNLMMSDATVQGNVAVAGNSPSGNVVLCPNPARTLSSCMSLATGKSQ